MTELRDFNSFVDLLEWRAARHPDKTAFRFFADGEHETGALSYAELLRQARVLAAELQAQGLQGQRLLLLYPPGLDFLPAFLGCLYAGAIPVPAYPPEPHRLQHTLQRLQSIIIDARTPAILTDSLILGQARELMQQMPQPGFDQLQWFETDAVIQAGTRKGTEAHWQRPSLSQTDVCFLQYTSGSTARPKGVIISHGNLLSNAAMFQLASGHQEQTAKLVCWVPVYHDMGLVGHLLNSLYIGGETLIMSPLAFLKKPLRWLKLISDHQATSTGAPNFAFDLCLRKISPAERDSLDLSSLRFALNAAEPIHGSTIEKFLAYFAPSGLRPDSLAPSYGMAETTVFISTAPPAERPRLLSVDRAALASDRIVRVSESHPEAIKLVACGRPWLDGKLLIVSPDQLRELNEDQVGEIWIQGPHVALGYWNQPELSAETFAARLEGHEGVFLRTGDLGFLHQGQVYVTGRRKDLIIVRGRNLYPQDLERSIDDLRAKSPVIRPGCGVAFSVEPDSAEQSAQSSHGEQIVIFQEVTLPPEAQHEDNFSQIGQSIATAITAAHDVPVWAVILVKPGSLPKTSSGKLMRQACRQAWAQGLSKGLSTSPIEILYRWQPHAQMSQPVQTAPEAEALASPAAGWQPWLIDWLSRSCQLPSDSLDLDQRFQTLGLDSLTAVQLVNDLEQASGLGLPETLLWEYPTPRALLAWLSDKSKDQPASAPQTPVSKDVNLQEPIAVIGMACRFPGGVNSPESFWELLSQGRDAMGPIPESRWDLADWYAPKGTGPVAGKMYVREGGFLDAIEQFEPGFFQISPREAQSLDPQQRLLLELAWETIENAGLNAQTLSQSETGVFIGLSNVDYSYSLHDSPERIDAYAGTGSAPSVAAGRIAYWLGLQGPALTLDTACSSSLVAVHQACQSLRLGESELAFAGGVNLILSPEGNLYFCQLQALAENSRCKSFDASADGFIRSEGGGLVLLKRLSQALSDGDKILGVIRGSAVNHDGPSNGLTAPNGRAQQKVITQALRQAGVKPQDLSFVETHGTGTPLGDPIEVQALQNTLLTPERTQPLYLGALKSNFGHLESAAGIAGLIKTLLSLQHRELPANLHFQTLNPRIEAHEQLCFPTQSTAWPKASPLLAGVSSFGISGTNAHLVLEAAPAQAIEPQPGPDKSWSIALSAHSEAALRGRLQQLQSWLSAHPETPLADLSYSLIQRRTPLRHRWAVQAASLDHLQQSLKDSLAAGVFTVPLNEPQAVFVFSGQGAQWPGMGRELLKTEPVFAEMIARCEAAFAPEVDWRLSEVLMTATEDDYSQMELIQPVIFAVQVALATLWQTWGLRPKAVIGHSMGEVAAAYIAGALSLADAARVICRRSRLLSQQAQASHGGMLFTGLAPEACAPYLSDAIMIGVYNGPDSTVLTGERSALEALHAQLEAAGTFSRFVQVPVAAHSAQIDVFEAPLKAALSGLEPQKPTLAMLSTVLATPLTAAPDADYWYQNLRAPVRFAQTVADALKQGLNLWIEISPHPLLLQTLQASARAQNKPILTLSSLKRAQPEQLSLHQSLLQSYMAGLTPRWDKFAPETGNLLSLPAYPWQRQAYWLEATPNQTAAKPRPQGAQAVFTAPPQTQAQVPAQAPSQAARGPSEQKLYQLHWESSPTPSPQSLPSGHWLVFSDHAVINQSLSLFLKPRGQQLIFIRSGHEPELGQPPFAIDPLEPEHYTRLIAHLNRHLKQPVNGIIFAWQPDQGPDFQPEQAEAAYTRLAHLLRALEALKGPTPRLYLVSRGAWQPEGSHLAQSVWWGLGRTAFYEYPQWHCSQIDLSPEPGPAELQLLANEVMAQSPESNLLLRGSERKVARVGAYQGADTPPPAPERSLLDKLLGRKLPTAWTPASRLNIRPDGIYVISGGLGELGLDSARWLHTQGAKHVALLGRSGAARSDQQQAVKALQETGLHVEVLTVDVADKQALLQALTQLRHTGPIKGILHAAGILSDGLLAGQTPEALREVFRPKITGGWNLHQLTLSDSLDVFVCYSSITATLGMPGQSNYAAANSFLDALMQHRRQQGLPGLSIDWGPWYRAEIALLGGKRQMLSQYGFHWLEHPKGFALMTQLLSDSAAQAAVMDLDVATLLQALPQTRNLPLISLLAREQNQPLNLHKPKPIQPLTPTKPAQASQSKSDSEFALRPGERPSSEELERFLQQAIARILGVSPSEINTQSALRGYGFDSLMALELKAQLQATYNIALTANERFQSMTISEISEQIRGGED